MLFISNSLLLEIEQQFYSCREEQGFLLGSSARLNFLDHCKQLPSIQSGRYFYQPDPFNATETIRYWANHRICFCGLIHSHIVNKTTLSENDLLFAETLFRTYQIPVLWFGLGIVHSQTTQFKFYSVVIKRGILKINPVNFHVL